MRFHGVVPSVALVVTEVRTLAGGLNGTIAAYADGTGQQAGFDLPFGVTVDSSSNVFVAERYSHRIRKVTPDGGMHEVHFVFLVSIVKRRFFFQLSTHPLAPR
jgi:hypothetical protein